MNENRIAELLNILECPISKGPLIFDKTKNMLYSKDAKVFYPIKEDIMVLLAEEAIKE